MKIYNTICITVYLLTFTYIVQIQCQFRHRRNDNSIQSGSDVENLDKGDYNGKGKGAFKNKEDCWMKFNASQLFDTMERLDVEYAEARKKFQEAIGNKEFDDKMLDAMLKSGAKADRAIQLVGHPSCIPAGLNLGGYCMLRLADSVLFFHRMKLRNDTRFRVNSLKNDLENMVMSAKLSLNDLHLVGTYERSITGEDPSTLYYTPTFGQVELLLKDVSYKMKGRYRLLKDKLYLEMVISEVAVNGGVLMIFNNKSSNSKPISLQEKNIADFLEKVKSDLNTWLLDYFNDYLILFELPGIENNSKLQQYDKKKSLALNDFFDKALTLMRKRLQKLNATSVKLPSFAIYSVSSTQVQLSDGLLYGLDSIYRRSLTTSSKKDHIREVDAIVGFSSLKVVYKYEVVLSTGMGGLTGYLVFSADELTAHLGLSLVERPESVDLTFDYIRQMKPESLTVEGSANKMIANFKHLLELHIIAIMSNSLLHQIKLLTTLTRCTPELVGYVDPNDLPYQQEADDSKSEAAEPEATTPPQETTNDDLNNKSEAGDNLNVFEDVPNENDGNNEPTFDLNFEEATETETNSTITPLADYIFAQEESLEVKLPPNASIPKKVLYVKRKENITLTAV